LDGISYKSGNAISGDTIQVLADVPRPANSDGRRVHLQKKQEEVSLSHRGCQGYGLPRREQHGIHQDENNFGDSAAGPTVMSHLQGSRWKLSYLNASIEPSAGSAGYPGANTIKRQDDISR
jgi:hypothetical protein